MEKYVTIEVDDVKVIDVSFDDVNKVVTVKTVTDFISEYKISYADLFNLLHKE